jgi:hypothetical protein
MIKKDDYTKKATQLIEAIGKVYPSTPQLIWKSFLQGIFFGLGTTIGVSIILTILTFTLNKMKLIPVFDRIINQTRIERIVPSSDRQNPPQ